MAKLKFAFYWAASCGGCEIAVLDVNELGPPDPSGRRGRGAPGDGSAGIRGDGSHCRRGCRAGSGMRIKPTVARSSFLLVRWE